MKKKRYRVIPDKHVVELGDQDAVGHELNVQTGVWRDFKLGEVRVYVDAIDELDAWIKVKKYLEEHPQ